MARSFRSSVPLLAVAYGTSSATTFLLTLAVGRSLGASELGTFALAVACARIFYAATDLGVATHMTRSISRDRSRARELISRFLTFRAALVPLAIVVSVGVARLYEVDAPLVFVCIATTQGVITLQALYESLLLSHDRQSAVAALTITSSACVVAGCATWYALRGGLVAFTASYLVATTIGLAAWAVWAARKLGTWPRLQLASRELGSDLAQSWRIGASVLLGIAALRVPVLVLGKLATPADVGAFSAADTFVIAVGIAQIAVTNATFPRLAAAFRTDPPKFRRIFWASNAAIALLGVLGGLALVVFGTRIVTLVFPGRDFDRLSELVPVLGASTPALLLVHHNIIIFAAADHEAANLRLMALWFALIAISQLALVPAYGLVGAGWGLLVARTLGLFALAVAIFVARVHRGETAVRTT